MSSETLPYYYYVALLIPAGTYTAEEFYIAFCTAITTYIKELYPDVEEDLWISLFYDTAIRLQELNINPGGPIIVSHTFTDSTELNGKKGTIVLTSTEGFIKSPKLDEPYPLY